MMIKIRISRRCFKMSYVCVIVTCFMLLTMPVFGQIEYPFETARPQYVGARALAMGNAFTAVADDATGGFWNPAGLIQGQGVKLFGSMKFYNRDEYRFDPKGIGFSWRGYSLYWGNKIAIDVSSGVPDYNYYSIARQLGPYFAAGLSLKFKRRHPSDYYQFFGYQTLYDIGLLSKPYPGFKFGCVLQNVEGHSIQWITLGTTYYQDTYQLSVDIVLSIEDLKSEFYIGAEWSPVSSLSLRIGNSNGAFTGGVGLHVMGMTFSYARIYEEFTVSDFISAEIRF